MKNLSDRITFIQDEMSWSNAEISRRVGVSRTAPTEWKSGKVQNLSAEVARKLSDATGYSATWLATGKGAMRESKHNVNESIDEYVVDNKKYSLQSNISIPILEELATDVFPIDVGDDSMSPEFDMGDTVLIEPCENPRPGKIVCAKQNDKYVFGRYRSHGLNESGDITFELLRKNQYYPSIKSSESNIEIIGVAIHVIKKL